MDSARAVPRASNICGSVLRRSLLSLTRSFILTGPRSAAIHRLDCRRAREPDQGRTTTTAIDVPTQTLHLFAAANANPAQTGTLAKARTRSRYPMTSAARLLLARSARHRDAYTEPWLLSQSCFILSGFGDGVTI